MAYTTLENEINLNGRFANIDLDEFEGYTQDIVLKVGRKRYYIDINVSSLANGGKGKAVITMYTYNKDRSKTSRYKNSVTVEVRRNAMLDKEFFENIQEIAELQIKTRKFDKYI